MATSLLQTRQFHQQTCTVFFCFFLRTKQTNTVGNALAKWQITFAKVPENMSDGKYMHTFLCDCFWPPLFFDPISRSCAGITLVANLYTFSPDMSSWQRQPFSFSYNNDKKKLLQYSSYCSEIVPCSEIIWDWYESKPASPLTFPWAIDNDQSPKGNGGFAYSGRISKASEFFLKVKLKNCLRDWSASVQSNKYSP